MKRITPLCTATFMQSTSIGMLIPVITHYVLSMGASEKSALLIFSIFSLFAFLSSFMWGKIVDKKGRKFVMFFSTLGITIAYAWLAVASTVWEIFASRAFAGIMSGFSIAAFAWVADSYDENSRPKAYGLLGASFGFGFIAGPAISGLLVQQDAYVLACFGSFLISLLSIFIIIFCINDSDKYERNLNPSFRELLHIEKFRPVIIVAGIVYLVFTMIETSFALYVYIVFQATARDVSMVLVLAGLAHVLVQGGISSKVIRKIGAVNTIRLAIIFLLFGLSSLIKIELLGFYMPMIFTSIAMALYMPALQSYSMGLAPNKLRGSVAGLLQSIQNLSRIPGPALAGFLMVVYWYKLSYVIGFVILLVPYYILRFTR